MWKTGFFELSVSLQDVMKSKYLIYSGMCRPKASLWLRKDFLSSSSHSVENHSTEHLAKNANKTDSSAVIVMLKSGTMIGCCQSSETSPFIQIRLNSLQRSITVPLPLRFNILGSMPFGPGGWWLWLQFLLPICILLLLLCFLHSWWLQGQLSQPDCSRSIADENIFSISWALNLYLLYGSFEHHIVDLLEGVTFFDSNLTFWKSPFALPFWRCSSSSLPSLSSQSFLAFLTILSSSLLSFLYFYLLCAIFSFQMFLICFIFSSW